MPRLSLYKPERGQDYTFMDRQISEVFQVGGTDVYLHKYLGTKNPTEGTADQPIYDTLSPTNIQDLLFLENRDRVYDTSIYKLRGFYNVQNIDFNLSQFGLFIDNDTIYMTVHINDFIKYIGRKPLSGDVLELPNLRDEFALSTADVSLPRYYVIEDVGRASEGFSATWYPHLYRLKLKKVTNNQQFADIFNTPTGADVDKFVGEYAEGTTYYTGQIVRLNGVLYQVTTGFEAPTGTTLSPPSATAWVAYSGNTLEDILSTRAKELEINDQILQQAESDAPKSGYETRQFFTLAVDDTTGKAIINQTDSGEVTGVPVRTGYTGYLVGDGFPSNGYDFGHGIQFPEAPAQDDFFLRTDFLPNRLFRFDGTRWMRVEDAVRMDMSNTDTRQTLKTSFINNTSYIYNQVVNIDYIKVPAVTESIPVDYNHVFETNFDYVAENTDALYLVFKLNTVEISFVIADHIGLFESYEYTDPTTSDVSSKIRITLPVINEEQQILPYDGTWKVSLCNNREAQRQSLSKALRPKADL